MIRVGQGQRCNKGKSMRMQKLLVKFNSGKFYFSLLFFFSADIRRDRLLSIKDTHQWFVLKTSLVHAYVLVSEAAFIVESEQRDKTKKNLIFK